MILSKFHLRQVKLDVTHFKNTFSIWKYAFHLQVWVKAF